MKRLLFFLTVFSLTCTVYSQIYPFKGIHNIDSCEFESQCHLLAFSDTANDLWQWGKPQKPGFGPAYSYPRAVMTDSLKPYPKTIHTYFDLVIPNTKYWMAKIVGFKHKYQTDTLKDGGYIEVSYDGKNWKNVIDEKKPGGPLRFHMENMYSDSDSLSGNKRGFSGTSNGWIYSRIEWIWTMPVKRMVDTLYLRFYFISDSVNNEKAGWVIDNLLISYPDLGSGIRRVKNDTKLKYSPNPMTTETVFSFDNSIKEKYTLQLYNSYGQLVKTQSEYHPQSLTLKRDNLNGGLYYFILKSESGFQSSGNLMIE